MSAILQHHMCIIFYQFYSGYPLLLLQYSQNLRQNYGNPLIIEIRNVFYLFVLFCFCLLFVVHYRRYLLVFYLTSHVFEASLVSVLQYSSECELHHSTLMPRHAEEFCNNYHRQKSESYQMSISCHLDIIEEEQSLS